MPVTSHTVVITAEQVDKLRGILERDHFDFIEKPYTLFAGKKGKLSISVYQKGPKVLIQGKETEDFVKFTLEPEIIGEARLGYEEVLQPDMFEPHFGIDESGKGDFFGPLVIAGAYTDATIARALMDLGIMDSKRITSAKRIRELAAKIRSVPGIATSIVAIGPERYNQLFDSFRNLNRLLAWGHARVIANLAKDRPNCPRALSDQFARADVLARALKKENVTIELEQRTKGEADIAVAAASILARERFIDWIDKTSESGGVTLPLGASDAVIAAGQQLVKRHGPTALAKVGKLHFRTSAKILGHSDPDGTESA